MFELNNNKIKITQGDTASLVISLDNYVLKTGDKVYFSVKEDVDSEDYVLQKIIENFDSKGKALVILSKDDTNIPANNYLYDIQYSLLDGRVNTIMYPTKFQVVGGITNE